MGGYLGDDSGVVGFGLRGLMELLEGGLMANNFFLGNFNSLLVRFRKLREELVGREGMALRERIFTFY